mmetsp:Transcript_19997/g.75527  ORF Transcript_19997/g.75527 Transcript_19997/m.75527 type:complete len:201 (-) Transcript_19997:83-685(-)
MPSTSDTSVARHCVCKLTLPPSSSRKSFMASVSACKPTAWQKTNEPTLSWIKAPLRYASCAVTRRKTLRWTRLSGSSSPPSSLSLSRCLLGMRNCLGSDITVSSLGAQSSSAHIASLSSKSGRQRIRFVGSAPHPSPTNCVTSLHGDSAMALLPQKKESVLTYAQRSADGIQWSLRRSEETPEERAQRIQAVTTASPIRR